MTDHGELIARAEQARSDYEYAKSARVAVAPGRAYALLDELVPALKASQATNERLCAELEQLRDGCVGEPCRNPDHYEVRA